jgi:hypothetical protein
MTDKKSAGAVARQVEEDDAANANLLSSFVNHMLTPGSSLSHTMQAAFNGIMIVLFMIWGVFLGTVPPGESLHVWIFGALIIGLTLSTNWFLSQMIEIKAETEREEAEEKKKKAQEEAAAAAAATAALVNTAFEADVAASAPAASEDDGMRQRNKSKEAPAAPAVAEEQPKSPSASPTAARKKRSGKEE